LTTTNKTLNTKKYSHKITKSHRQNKKQKTEQNPKPKPKNKKQKTKTPIDNEIQQPPFSNLFLFATKSLIDQSIRERSRNKERKDHTNEPNQPWILLQIKQE